MKRNFFSLTTLVAVVALLFASCAKDFGDDLKRVDGKVDALKTELTGKVGTDIAKAKSDLETSMKTQVDKVNAQISALNEQLAAKENELKQADEANKQALSGEIDKIKSDLVANYVTLKALEDYKKEVTEKLAEINSAVEKLASKKDLESTDATVLELAKQMYVRTQNAFMAIGANMNDIKDNKASIATINETIKGLQGDIKSLNEKLVALETTVTSNAEQAKKDLEAVKKELSEKLSKLSEAQGKLEGRLALLEAAVKANKETADSKFAGLEKQLEELAKKVGANSASIKDLQDQIDATMDQVDGINEDLTETMANLGALTKLVGEYKGALDGKIDANKAELDGKIADTKKELQANIDAVNTKLEALDKRVSDLETGLATQIAKLDKVIDVLGLNFKAIGKRLTSIVAISEYNYNGLPALYVPTIATIDGDCGNIQKKDGYVVEYHLNPSFIGAEEVNLANAVFIGIKTTNLRSASSQDVAKAYVTAKGTTAKIENGVLKLPVSVNHAALEKDGYAQNASKFVKVALQLPLADAVLKQYGIKEGEKVELNGKEYPAAGVVTSDYVAIYGKTLRGNRDLFLAREAKEGSDVVTHLVTTADEAKALEVKGVGNSAGTDPSVLEVPFALANSEAGIDLVKYVRTILKVGGENLDFNIDEYGLTYKFDLLDENGRDIKYVLNDQDGNQTDQQKYILLENGKAFPAANGKKNAIAAQGRTPIVRVRLVKDNCVVMNGFIKLRWMEKADLEPKTFEFNFATPTVLDCDNQKKITHKVSVAQMNEVYTALGLSAKEFANIYKVNLGGQARVSGIGGVALNTDEPVDGTRTEVITWTFTQEEAWKELAPSANNTVDVECTYTFIPNDTKNHPQIVVKVTGKVTREGFDAINLTNADLSEGAWVPNPVMNVTTPTPAVGPYTNTPEFEYNLDNFFKTKKVGNELVTTFGTALNGAYHYQFVLPENTGSYDLVVDGKTYRFTVDYKEDNSGQLIRSALLINGSEVASLSGKNLRKFTFYKTNSDALELLNSKRVGGLFAFVEIITTRCTEFDRINRVTINGKDSFRIDFTRPVSMNLNEVPNLTDDVNFGAKGSYVTVKDLVNLTEWRKDAGRTKYRSFAMDKHLWKYYGVKSVEADLDKAVTNYQNITTNPNKFDLVADAGIQLNLDVSQDADKIAQINYNPGRITYKNNNAKVAEFKIKVPVKVTYMYGVLEDVVTITVKNTTDVQ